MNQTTFTDRAAAEKARKMALKPGMDGPTLKAAFGFKYSSDAWTLAAIGRHWHGIDSAQLTDGELKLLKEIADCTREQLARGITTSPKGKWISRRLGKSAGWAASTAAKRLESHRKDDDPRHRGTGLNLCHNGGGFFSLTLAGWALILALESVTAPKGGGK